MRYARLAVEILLRLLLWATRLAFLAAGLATLGPALLLSSSFMGDGTSAWLVALARPTLAMGVVFLAAAVLLFVIPWLLRGVPRAAPEAAAAPGPAAPAAGGGWQWLAGPVMLAWPAAPCSSPGDCSASGARSPSTSSAPASGARCSTAASSPA
jgi:hypothetical protein